MHELSARLSVVEETELTQLGDGLRGEVEPGDQVVVVVVRDGEELQPTVPSLSGEVDDVVGAEGDVLRQSGRSKTGGATFSGTRPVRITWLRTSPRARPPQPSLRAKRFGLASAAQPIVCLVGRVAGFRGPLSPRQ